jgi:6-phosphofructokinase 1
MAGGTTIRRVGVLTGGGDCPGLNAVIRAVTKSALSEGLEVVGIEDGFLGLVENRVRPLTAPDVAGILTAGGTILGSNNKTDPERLVVGTGPDGKPIHRDGMDACMMTLEHNAVDALIVIGGDGTMTIADKFVKRGVPCIGVPKTIDNDLVGTEITFGFLTATSIASEAIDRVRTTAASHHRIMVVEVMGRNAGWIALHSGVASGADVILLPEIPFTLESLERVVMGRAQRGSRYSIICCAEGAKPKGGAQIVAKVDPTSPDPIRLGGVGKFVAEQLEKATGIESRYVVLGHVQRGGTPVPADRVLSTQFGFHAAMLMHQRKWNRMVAMQQNALTDVALTEAAGKQRLVGMDDPVLAAARGVYTMFGDER